MVPDLNEDDEKDTAYTVCAFCPSGTHGDGYGCTTCPAGTVSQIGQECEPCPAGTYANAGEQAALVAVPAVLCCSKLHTLLGKCMCACRVPVFCRHHARGTWGVLLLVLQRAAGLC